jgi:hypothetical protein
VINQVKGNNRVKNIRLTQVMPIVHDLIKHFNSIELNWVAREQNGVADAFARNSATHGQNWKEQLGV